MSAAEYDEQNPQRNSRRKGGIITLPFIIANEAFERVASLGLMPNMVLYLMKEYKLKLLTAQNILFIWSAVSNFTPLLGAFIADSFLGRFLAIFLGSSFTFLGMLVLWLTAMIPQATPPPCNPMSGAHCESATSGQMAFLLLSFALMSIGSGGIKPCSLAFGADQMDRRDNPNNDMVLESYFGWYYAAAAFSALIAITVVVYIQDHAGWKVGFGVPTICMFLSTTSFLLASSLYLKRKEKNSLFTGLAQAIVAAYKNRNLELPSHDSPDVYHSNLGDSDNQGDSDYVRPRPSNRLRFLNKACLIKNSEVDIAPDGSAVDPWRLCTVQKVEELKALIKVMPIWSAGVILNLTINTGSFGLIQAKSMNRHITSNFEIPAGSFSIFLIATVMIWVALYDRILIPVASKIRGKPTRLSIKLRMGIGIFLACLHMVATALIETVRRNKAIEEGYINNPEGLINMSAMWLVIPMVFTGLSEAFFVIAQNEFYYVEFPKSMSSIAASLTTLNSGVANLLADAVMNMVKELSGRGGRQSWLDDNINKGHLNYYYGLLDGLAFVNTFYYALCSWLYGPCGNQDLNVQDHMHEAELVNLESRKNRDE